MDLHGRLWGRLLVELVDHFYDVVKDALLG